MKIVLKWLVVLTFALQATDAIWYVHLAGHDGADGLDDACRLGQPCDANDPAASVQPEADHPAGPGKPPCHHHDSQSCPICQVLMSLWATASIPPSLASMAQTVPSRPIATERPFVDVFRAAIDARAPPA